MIIKRERRRSGTGRIVALAGAGGVAVLGTVAVLAWQQGAPRPRHEIVVDLPPPAFARNRTDPHAASPRFAARVPE